MDFTSNITRSRFLGVGAILLPAIALVLAKSLLPAPASARAAVASKPDAPASSLAIPDDAWLRSLRGNGAREAIEGSPFPRLTILDPDVPDAFASMPEPEEPPAIEPEPEVKLTTVMRSVNGDVALIDGKAHRVGSRVSGQWVVSEIHPATRTVTIRNETDGREFVVQLKGHLPG